MATAKKKGARQPAPPAPKKKEITTSAAIRGKMAKAPESRMPAKSVNARVAKNKLGALSNKPDGKWASPSMQAQFGYAKSQQEAMYPGSKWKGFYTVKPGRADAKPSPKKQPNIKKK